MALSCADFNRFQRIPSLDYYQRTSQEFCCDLDIGSHGGATRTQTGQMAGNPGRCAPTTLQVWLLLQYAL